jgi:hypothetical protein
MAAARHAWRDAMRYGPTQWLHGGLALFGRREAGRPRQILDRGDGHVATADTVIKYLCGVLCSEKLPKAMAASHVAVPGYGDQEMVVDGDGHGAGDEYTRSADFTVATGTRSAPKDDERWGEQPTCKPACACGGTDGACRRKIAGGEKWVLLPHVWIAVVHDTPYVDFEVIADAVLRR